MSSLFKLAAVAVVAEVVVFYVSKKIRERPDRIEISIQDLVYEAAVMAEALEKGFSAKIDSAGGLQFIIAKGNDGKVSYSVFNEKTKTRNQYEDLLAGSKAFFEAI